MRAALTLAAWGFAFAMFATALLIAGAATNLAVILFIRVFSVH